MRLMYTLLLQYDKSKYVDFDVFPFWFVATYKTEFEKHQTEWERANEKNNQSPRRLLHTRMQQSKLVSWSNKRRAMHSFAFFCTSIRCILLLLFDFGFYLMPVVAAKMNAKSKNKFEITQPEDDSCVCALACAHNPFNSSRINVTEYDNRENATKNICIHSAHRCKKCLKKMQHN